VSRGSMKKTGMQASPAKGGPRTRIAMSRPNRARTAAARLQPRPCRCCLISGRSSAISRQQGEHRTPGGQAMCTVSMFRPVSSEDCA